MLLTNESLYPWQGKLKGTLRINYSFLFLCLTLYYFVVGAKIVRDHIFSLGVICMLSGCCLLIGIGKYGSNGTPKTFGFKVGVSLKVQGGKIFGELWFRWIFVRWFWDKEVLLLHVKMKLMRLSYDIFGAQIWFWIFNSKLRVWKNSRKLWAGNH